ncbi:MAG TPA: hypothetical protein VD867_05790 [Burkholderiales bacterium]|nr:hypothetical protein [Burkholderiales bacterium]
MRLKLIPNWKKDFPKLYSVRFALAAAAACAVDIAITAFLSGKPPVLSSLAGISSLAAAFGRIIYQPEVHQDEKP